VSLTDYLVFRRLWFLATKIILFETPRAEQTHNFKTFEIITYYT